MPIYEYKCKKCNHVTSFIEKVDEFKFFGRKCSKCGSRKTMKVMSGFATARRVDMPSMINELKKYGPVNFVPGPPPAQGPPPGGCPYEQKEAKDEKKQ